MIPAWSTIPSHRVVFSWIVLDLHSTVLYCNASVFLLLPWAVQKKKKEAQKAKKKAGKGGEDEEKEGDAGAAK